MTLTFVLTFVPTGLPGLRNWRYGESLTLHDRHIVQTTPLPSKGEDWTVHFGNIDGSQFGLFSMYLKKNRSVTRRVKVNLDRFKDRPRKWPKDTEETEFIRFMEGPKKFQNLWTKINTDYDSLPSTLKDSVTFSLFTWNHITFHVPLILHSRIVRSSCFNESKGPRIKE